MTDTAGQSDMTPRPPGLRRWIRLHRPVAMALIAVAGMAVGALVYLTLRLSGAGLYVISGGATAVLGALAWQWVTRSASISEVEVTLPQFSKITFAVTRDHKVLARRILIQMTSRVSVQPLEDDTGRADEAIASLKALHDFVRNDLLSDAETRAVAGRPDVDTLAMNMNNEHLRPFLSKWHRVYGDWRTANPDAPESQWEHDKEFRLELAQLQARLKPIAVAFARFCGYEDYHQLIGLDDA